MNIFLYKQRKEKIQWLWENPRLCHWFFVLVLNAEAPSRQQQSNKLPTDTKGNEQWRCASSLCNRLQPTSSGCNEMMLLKRDTCPGGIVRTWTRKQKIPVSLWFVHLVGRTCWTFTWDSAWHETKERRWCLYWRSLSEWKCLHSHVASVYSGVSSIW